MHNIPTIDEVAPAGYTVIMFDADMRALTEAYPSNRNPKGDEDACVCVYRSAEGMCLIGLWADFRGHSYQEDWEGRSARQVLQDVYYPYLVAARASEWQTLADNRRSDAGPRPWGKVLV